MRAWLTPFLYVPTASVHSTSSILCGSIYLDPQLVGAEPHEQSTSELGFLPFFPPLSRHWGSFYHFMIFSFRFYWTALIPVQENSGETAVFLLIWSCSGNVCIPSPFSPLPHVTRSMTMDRVLCYGWADKIFSNSETKHLAN